MSSRPDKAQEQLRQENRWWQTRYRRLQKHTDRLKREVQELQEQQRRLPWEIAESRVKLYKARPAPEEAQAPHPPKKRGAPKGPSGWSRPVPRHADRHVEVTVDETGWRKEDVNYWLWCVAVARRHLR
jgi:septal ring factor EnvC (AmiA/AmiB activator)